jgi:site-specific DNA-methyltransferase (adenine-specific)
MRRAKRREPFAHLAWERSTEDLPQPAELSLKVTVSPGAHEDQTQSTQNRLIAGDNLAVMLALLPEYEGRIDLLYADPPFLSGKAYAARVGRGEDSRKPSQWKTTTGYSDRWRDGAQYLDMLYPRLQLMHRLLSPQGTLYLHLDWHAAAYARLLLDELFGPDRLLNEIVWVYHGPSPIRSAFKRKHDTILVYSKSSRYTFNADAVRMPYDPNTFKTFASSPAAGFGKKPDLESGKVPEDWWYFPVVARLHGERTGYPTQKPEALLERIILASSNAGDIVGDFFCGSGTAAAVAARHRRQWIACDFSALAVMTTYRRLLLQPRPVAFSCWQEASLPHASAFQPQAKISIAGRSANVELIGLRGTVIGEHGFADRLQCWEVDWNFDGSVFHSQSQSVRAFRGKELPLQLSWRYERPARRQLAIRAIDLEGQTGLAQYPIQIR